MKAPHLSLFSLLALSLLSCSPGTNRDSKVENPSLTQAEIRKQKPPFPDVTPTEYPIGFEPTFIRVVTNSTRLQEVWMVYYDPDAKKWERISLGKGSGENNNIIGDHKFEKRYGFGKSYEDAPEFYARYSDDDGQTWKSHSMQKAVLNCDERGKDPKANWNAHLLTSALLNPKNGLPDVAIIFQWTKTRAWNGPAASFDLDFKRLCGVLKEIPLAGS